MKKITILLAALCLFSLSGFGCISFSSSPQGAAGGIWKSTDQAELWEQKVSFPTSQGVGKVGHVGVQVLEIDPSDHLAIYAGTVADGLLFSFNGADTWNSAKDLSEGPISAIAVNPADKCTIYAGSRNKIYKSTDCNRTFSQVYYETRIDTDVLDIEVDWYNNSIVYAGTSEGDLVKSTDAGASWSALGRFESDINDIALDPFDSRVMYVGTKKKGLWKTADGGENWFELKEELSEFKNAREIYAIAIDKTSQDTVIISTPYGLLRSYDGGAAWSGIELLTPPGEATIRALALNPREGKEIYYATASTIYKSVDAGQSWVTKKVPAAGWAADVLAVDPENGSVIYLGVVELKKESF